jgi:hypothetical protein
VHEILKFLVDHCSFLWTDGRYRIVDSDVSTSFGGDAFLIVTSDALRLRFVRDRGQLFLDVQDVGSAGRDDWYSLDLLWRLIKGERRNSAVLDEEYARFLRESLPSVESHFVSEHLPETTRTLHELKRARARELFG